ncbi:MAG: SusC/RagA family TonB-linked outer membrane protein [Bacteroidetes bacterium HGW-Bacteroidetes-11]|jgi:TonB-linked SusC/RagA family outer membrane protein|nr:MAG: SusC/RagA family TonB-linked outer membrane protein [Bacteroidetes bacterium HGW-Bacteroidetes-11]
MRTHLYKLLIIVMSLLNAGVLFAQNHTVTGIITDKESGLGMPGVTVVEAGTFKGTTTDIDGKYSLTVSSPSATLEISFIGFTTQRIQINSRAAINLVLIPEVTQLSELVVVGYGTQKKKVVTGAISSVTSQEITSTPVLRIDQAMQGRTAGVQVTNLSGQPGEAPTIRIRGAGTTGNASPLYIVDGIAVGGIDYLNPGDIESIDVLKDAASAAIYGARAANGVVLITTKSGKAGKMSITYSGYTGIQNVAKKLDMLDSDQYRMIMNEGARNSGLSEPFDLNEIPAHNTNWQDHLFVKNAPMQNHEVSITGGSEKTTYASSMSYFSQQGIIGGEKSQFDRITARLNTKSQVNKVFSFGNNLSYTHIIRRGIGSNESFNGAYSSALNLDPLTPLYEENPDNLNLPPYSNEPVVKDKLGRTYGISNYVGAEVVNPLALLEIQTGETRVDKIVGSIFGEAEIIKGLKVNTSLGIDLAYVLNDSYRPLYYLNGAQLNIDKTSVSKGIDRYFTWQWENTISYTKQISDHNFSLLAGTTASKFKYENLTGFNAKVPLFDPDNVYLNMATDTVWVATGGASHSALASIFGRVNYDYKSKYSFTGILRRDGSSKFGANNRFGIFPSLGVSWVASDESFFPKIKNLDQVKFRASWGINGNQEIGDYQFISTINKSRGYIFGSGRIVGASPSYIENADIRWEESIQTDIAIDLAAFNNRLLATVDYYIKTTSGLLERIPIPGHVGNDAPVANVGSVENRGVEVSVNWRHKVKEFRYAFGVNASYNKNKMTKIGNEEKVLPGASWAIAGAVTRAEEGLPIAYFWGYKTDGLFQNQSEIFQHIGSTGQVLQPNAKPGDVRFVDVNGDGKIDADDRTMIGNPTPDWTLGFNASAEYRNFDFSILLIGTLGNEIFNGSQRQDLRYTNRTTAILDRWTAEGTSTEVPRYTWIDVNNNYRVSDLYIEDGSYLRVKNVQIGYTLPSGLLRRMGASTWRFYVSAENLLTFTKYTGADPEIGARSSFDIGIDRGIYPQARTWRLGTSITF